MPYVTQDDIRKAREMDLLTYLRNYEPDELVHVGGDTYCTREHDSLKISNGKWYWFSKGVGGKSALDYLITVRQMPFPAAVEHLIGQTERQAPVYHASKTTPERNLEIPEANDNNNAVVRYLTGRGIAPQVITDCAEKGILYESKKYHNDVFIGRDESGKARYAALRGTYGDFKGEARGSDKRYSFLIADNPETDSVHLFESAIDLMSYTTLLLMTGRDWKRDAFLSLGGVHQAKRNGTIPAALDRYLAIRPNTKSLLLHLDNDEVGRGASADIISQLGDRYRVIDSPSPIGKDVNDYLKMKVQRHRQQEVQAR